MYVMSMMYNNHNDFQTNTTTDAVKLRVIECDAALIERAAQQLAHVDLLQRTLDSEHILAACAQLPKSSSVAAKQAQLLQLVHMCVVVVAVNCFYII